MSWFTDIAGRAEDFLTKMDQTAATALQSAKLPNAKTTLMSYAKSPNVGPNAGSTSGSLPKTTKSTAMSLTSSSSPKPRRSSLQNSDDKLLEFLNSPEPTPLAPKRSSSLVRTVRSRSPAKQTPDEDEDVGAVDRSTAKGTDQDVSGADVAEQDPVVRRASIQQEELLKSAACDVDAASDDSKLEGLEQENRLLRKEVSCLNQEVATALQRAKNTDLEKKHLQSRMDHWNSQVSSSDSAIRELQARERDLSSALDAKDAQLAVLRVRLQEADQELGTKRRLVEELRTENQRLSKEQADVSQAQGQTVDALRDKLSQTEEALRKEQECHRVTQSESMQRQHRMEGEIASLSESLTLAQRQLTEQKAHAKEATSQASSLRCSLDLARQELADYKNKAQRILQSKEKLIASLKDAASVGGSPLDLSDSEGNRSNISAAELEATTQECEQLRAELQRTQAQAEALSADFHEQESALRREVESLQEQQRALLEEVRQERHQRQDAELESRQAAQIMTKSMSTTSEAELEARLHALTESLIQKQTLVEALSTEKNSLTLQLERMERQMKESQMHGPKPHTAIAGFGQSSEDNTRARLPGMFTESPFDGTMTRKVKRAYGVIDSFSVRAGVFLRRYPLARIFILVYMGLLHFWVMIVLLTYEPEIHGPHSLTKQTGGLPKQA
ncbi:muscle myosin heavy chain, putative [Ixodes scapularis]|uniref:Muscle myosin heavy chain, putative n=1 Tax=Ixodes scapularis TaxID=6945 RepID=B7QNW2_IXOSC|nr:muscle myosin heavy chain, putative [Ixodes scapularis]|eukprot:XP_002416618.1 muscle myosin heavy chain, putative [Ixodes scapularis]